MRREIEIKDLSEEAKKNAAKTTTDSKKRKDAAQNSLKETCDDKKIEEAVLVEIPTADEKPLDNLKKMAKYHYDRGYKAFNSDAITEETLERAKELNKRLEEFYGETTTETPEEYEWSFDAILNKMSKVHAKKNSDYNNAAHQAYKELGMTYYLSMLYNKIIRLKSLTLDKRVQQVLDESVDDTLLDLANYAVLALESKHKKDPVLI